MLHPSPSLSLYLSLHLPFFLCHSSLFVHKSFPLNYCWWGNGPGPICPPIHSSNAPPHTLSKRDKYCIIWQAVFSPEWRCRITYMYSVWTCVLYTNVICARTCVLYLYGIQICTIQHCRCKLHPAHEQQHSTSLRGILIFPLPVVRSLWPRRPLSIVPHYSTQESFALVCFLARAKLPCAISGRSSPFEIFFLGG